VLGGGTQLDIALEPVRASDHPARLATAVRTTIEDALRATRGKIYGADGAAARLGLPPATLQSKLARLGIDRAAFR
jgi:transcriptional regulator with GAF, ATPase, and Fis domain